MNKFQLNGYGRHMAQRWLSANSTETFPLTGEERVAAFQPWYAKIEACAEEAGESVEFTLAADETSFGTRVTLHLDHRHFDPTKTLRLTAAGRQAVHGWLLGVLSVSARLHPGKMQWFQDDLARVATSRYQAKRDILGVLRVPPELAQYGAETTGLFPAYYFEKEE